MVDPTAFSRARLAKPDASLAAGVIQAYGVGKQYGEQDAARDLSDNAVQAWQSGDKENFRNALGQLATVDNDAANGLGKTLGTLDRTNFVEAAYHVYNAANSSDPKAVNVSLQRGIDTLGVQPDHPFAQGLKDVLVLPPGKEKDAKVLAAFNYANQLGAYGQSGSKDALAQQKLAVQRGNLMTRLKELELAKTKEERIATRQKFIDDFGEVPENFYRDPKDPRKLKSKPGSVTHEKRQGEKFKRIQLYNTNIVKGDRLSKQINQVVEDTSMWTSGTLGNFLKYIPGLPAADLQSIVGTISANIGFDRLQEMRLQSPTGGALGQVAVQELEALQASIANLEQSQSPTQLKSNLQLVNTHYSRFLDTAKKAREELRGLDPDDLYSAATARLLSEDPLENTDLEGKSAQELRDLF